MNVPRRTIYGCWRAAMLSVLMLGGCATRPQDVVDACMRAASQRDARQMGAFCAPALRCALTNALYARRIFDYGVKAITWKTGMAQPVSDGMLVPVSLEIALAWPPPFSMTVFAQVRLQQEHRRWFISAVQVQIPRYVEYVGEPQQFQLPIQMPGNPPRWLKEQALNEPLQDFVARFDHYVFSWTR